MAVENFIGACGSYCGSCPIRIAQEKGIEVQKKLASALSSQMGREIRVHDIQCRGCRDSAKDRSSWAFRCKMRKCASGKGAETCASCGEYPCRDFKSLDGIYGGLLGRQLGELGGLGSSGWVSLMEERWKCGKCGGPVESSLMKCAFCNADNSGHVRKTFADDGSDKK